MGFRQQIEHHQEVECSEACGHPNGKGHGHPGQLPANEGAKDEPQAKGHADQAEGPGSLVGRRDVGEHGAGCCCRTATDAVNDPCCEQQQQGQQALAGPRQ